MRHRCRLSILFIFAAFCLAPPLVSKPNPARRNRIVRVVTVSQDMLQGKASDELVSGTLARLNQAASFRPDIACLPELFTRNAPEAVPGPTTERLGAWARTHSSYVLFGMKTKTGDRVYNSAILIDRQGRVVGQYNKLHPTEGEIEEGTTPGEAGVQIFETDFGTIGIQICFDVNWWEVWKRLKQGGAKIVFFPSAYPAATQLSALALVNQFYIVSSTNSGPSKIFDITGKVLASSGRHEPWAAAALPLGKRLFEVDYHISKARQIQQKYGSKVELAWYNEDDWFTLASVDPELTTEEVIAEFGLTPLEDYRVRAARVIDGARERAAKRARK
jgi:beta-ureidopropionase